MNKDFLVKSFFHAFFPSRAVRRISYTYACRRHISYCVSNISYAVRHISHCVSNISYAVGIYRIALAIYRMPLGIYRVCVNKHIARHRRISSLSLWSVAIESQTIIHHNNTEKHKGGHRPPSILFSAITQSRALQFTRP